MNDPTPATKRDYAEEYLVADVCDREFIFREMEFDLRAAEAERDGLRAQVARLVLALKPFCESFTLMNYPALAKSVEDARAALYEAGVK